MNCHTTATTKLGRILLAGRLSQQAVGLLGRVVELLLHVLRAVLARALAGGAVEDVPEAPLEGVLDLAPLRDRRVGPAPPKRVWAPRFAPAGIGAMPTFLRAAGTQFVSSLRPADWSVHGPPIHTAILPPLNWVSTCVPSRSSWLGSYRPSLIRSAMNSTPWAACGVLIVDCVASSLSSAPP